MPFNVRREAIVAAFYNIDQIFQTKESDCPFLNRMQDIRHNNCLSKCKKQIKSPEYLITVLANT